MGKVDLTRLTEMQKIFLANKEIKFPSGGSIIGVVSTEPENEVPTIVLDDSRGYAFRSANPGAKGYATSREQLYRNFASGILNKFEREDTRFMITFNDGSRAVVNFSTYKDEV